MTTVILVIHIMVAVALIVVVLLQRSEGGALGIGGGGGFMTGRSAGNALTKTTAVLAAMFFATSLGLTMIASRHTTPTSIFGTTSAPGQGNLPGLVLPSAPAAPGGAAPAAPAPSGAAAPQAPAAPQPK